MFSPYIAQRWSIRSAFIREICGESLLLLFAVAVVFAPADGSGYNFQNYQTANSEVICYQPIMAILALVAILAIPSAFPSARKTVP